MKWTDFVWDRALEIAKAEDPLLFEHAKIERATSGSITVTVPNRLLAATGPAAEARLFQAFRRAAKEIVETIEAGLEVKEWPAVSVQTRKVSPLKALQDAAARPEPSGEPVPERHARVLKPGVYSPQDLGAPGYGRVTIGEGVPVEVKFPKPEPVEFDAAAIGRPRADAAPREEMDRSQILRQKGHEIGDLVAEKDAAYGNSFDTIGDALRLLYPNGIAPDQYVDALGIVRVWDKLKRIATDQDALGESPWQDVGGYGLLGAVRADARKASARADTE